MQSISRVARYFLGRSFPIVARSVNLFLPPVIVLAYHRVVDIERDPQLLAVSCANFDAQLAWIARNDVEVVAFDQPWKAFSRKIRVCITFDDGYADNYYNALRILEKYNFPATFFVTTRHCSTGEAYWWDVLEHILYNKLPSVEPPEPFNRINPDSVDDFYGMAHGILINAMPEAQSVLLLKLCNWLGIETVADDAHRPMRPNEVASLAGHPLAVVGAHTHSHPRLSQLTYSQQRDEIGQSVRMLTEWTGQKTSVFAYPFGYRTLLGCGGDFNRDSMQICREMGMLRAAANYPSQARPWTNPFAIPRHLVRNWSCDEFSIQFAQFLATGHF